MILTCAQSTFWKIMRTAACVRDLVTFYNFLIAYQFIKPLVFLAVFENKTFCSSFKVDPFWQRKEMHFLIELPLGFTMRLFVFHINLNSATVFDNNWTAQEHGRVGEFLWGKIRDTKEDEFKRNFQVKSVLSAAFVWNVVLRYLLF